MVFFLENDNGVYNGKLWERMMFVYVFVWLFCIVLFVFCEIGFSVKIEKYGGCKLG